MTITNPTPQEWLLTQRAIITIGLVLLTVVMLILATRGGGPPKHG